MSNGFKQKVEFYHATHGSDFTVRAFNKKIDNA